ncbi:hypothetical protein OOK27_05075 [Streptomyces canus]|uniref:hypothetical protein n=1 Tax=Streptomyces canus TaxID=58343 RepID=UPI002258ECF7|nr:hypothetical protein [Streptomyces canus]MCX5253544.1 hypothetical protein [Streptomyces canus]
MTATDMDPFWVESRAKFLAAKSTVADPSACGTCRGLAAEGEPVKHDECQQRATLLQAPDHPHYEILAGFSLEENEQLPARFHVPVFDDLGKPNSWLCAVCWEEGTVVGWPCATAVKYGTEVFTPLDKAETAQEKQAAELAAYRALDLGDLDGRVSATCDNPEHPTWLRTQDDNRGCPWCRIDEVRTKVLAEAKDEVVTWLTKKAREFRANGEGEQADTASLLASKVARGAVRPNNLRMLPPDFFEPDHAYSHRDGSTFRCVAVTTHPDGGERVALGWHTDTADWTFVAVRNINHWTHEYDGVEPPAPQHYDKVPDPLDGCHWCACGNRWPCKGDGAVTG